MINITGLTQQQAVELLAYVFEENSAYMQRLPTMTNGPRWRWYKGKLWLQSGICQKLIAPRPCMYPEAKTSKDWAVFAEEKFERRVFETEPTTYYTLFEFMSIWPPANVLISAV